MTVEFSTICENGKLVDTTDMADISPLRKSVRKSTWKIPQIKSISTLYQAHREHLRVIGSCGILTSVTPQEAIDECMTESHREFEEQVQLGGMVTDRSNLRYYLSWPQAVWGTWKLVWPVRQVLRARIFAESRKRLRKFGLVHNRQRADYIAVFDSLRSSADIPPLPEVE
ncbi:MAG: hypothetical protein IPK83_15965 [Planctomycetes bacterium]|nr:hypothetical protein [Planctomycetota bacterium]